LLFKSRKKCRVSKPETRRHARETREEEENDMRSVIAIVTKLCAAMVAALLLTTSLSGQVPLNPRAGTIKPEMQIKRSDHLGPARDKYRFQDIDVEEAQSYTAIFDINNWGLAVGDYVDAANNFNAFLWRNGDRKPLADPTGTLTNMVKVNDRGLVIGDTGSIAVQHAAVFKLATGTWTLLPDVAGKTQNYAMDMNNAGRGVGQACEGDWNNPMNCVGWMWDGNTYTFTNIPGTTSNYTGPLAINDRGQVVGQYLDDGGHMHTYLLEHSKMTILDVPGASDTVVNDISSSGEVILDALYGDLSTNPNQNFLWRRGVYTPLPNHPDPAAVHTFSLGMNDRGDWCGRWFDENWVSHAFIAFRQSP
jgi:hypothetical protein